FRFREQEDGLLQPTESFFLQHHVLGGRFVQCRIQALFQRRSKPAVITILAIPGGIMSNAEEPTPDVLLRPGGSQMPLEAKERVLEHVLRLIGRKAETYQVAKQRFAQLAIQRGGLAASCQARERQNQRYGVATHKTFASSYITCEHADFPVDGHSDGRAQRPRLCHMGAVLRALKSGRALLEERLQALEAILRTITGHLPSNLLV